MAGSKSLFWNSHPAAGLTRIFDCLAVADQCAKIGNDGIVDPRHLVAEMSDSSNARKGIDLSPPSEIIEARKQVTRKQSLCRPEWPTRPHPPETNARREDSDR